MAGRLMVPQRAKPGDTVAIVSPSAPGVAWWPHRVARGRAYLESLGLKVRLMPNAGKGGGGAAGTPQERAADIHEAFLDERVSVVLASIGGDHSDQVLPHLDFQGCGRSTDPPSRPSSASSRACCPTRTAP